jgi:hypothetical protein
MVDPFADLLSNTDKSNGCGCDNQFSRNLESLSNPLPTPEVMEAFVNQPLSASSEIMNDLDLALAESLLDVRAGLPGSADDGISLQDIIGLAEKYPGLKISISFG